MSFFAHPFHIHEIFCDSFYVLGCLLGFLGSLREGEGCFPGISAVVH